jgi:hypothetical protein
LVALFFAVSGGLAIAGQLRITAWFRSKWGSGQCLALGLILMAAAFLPPILTSGDVSNNSPVLTWLPLMLSAGLLALGTIVLFPFEMDTIVTLSGNRLIATHYGLYNTVVGVGILLGNLVTGSVLDLARAAHLPEVPWLALGLIGVMCAWCLRALDAANHLAPAVTR